MRISQKIALEVFLSEYARDLDFKTNLRKIALDEEGDSDIVVCSFYEYMPRKDLAETIEDLAMSIQNAIESGEGAV